LFKKIHKERKGRDEEEEGVSSCRMTLQKEKIEEAVVLTLWRIRVGRAYGPIVKQTT
jgi:hypothetical protein